MNQFHLVIRVIAPKTIVFYALYFFFATPFLATASQVSHRIVLDTTIDETIKPVAICKQGLSFNLSPTLGLATILATQVDSASFDNFTKKENLRFFVEILLSTKPTPLPTSTEVYIACQGKKWLRLWVVDEAGNTDYCDTEITLIDYWGPILPEPTYSPSCPPFGENYININGKIVREDGGKIRDVRLFYETDTTKNSPYEYLQNGVFFQEGIEKGKDFTFYPQKNNVKNDGLTTEDLVLIHKHILNFLLVTFYRAA